MKFIKNISVSFLKSGGQVNVFISTRYSKASLMLLACAYLSAFVVNFFHSTFDLHS